MSKSNSGVKKTGYKKEYMDISLDIDMNITIT